MLYKCPICGSEYKDFHPLACACGNWNFMRFLDEEEVPLFRRLWADEMIVPDCPFAKIGDSCAGHSVPPSFELCVNDSDKGVCSSVVCRKQRKTPCCLVTIRID